MLKTIGPGESGYNRYDMRIADEAVVWLREASQSTIIRAPGSSISASSRRTFRWSRRRTLFRSVPDRGHAVSQAASAGTATNAIPWVEEHAQFSQTDNQFAGEEERLLAIAAYHALCTFVDERLGAVLDTLDATGLSDRRPG